MNDKNEVDAAIEELKDEHRRLKRQIEFLKTTHDSCGNCNKCAEGMGKVFDENLDELKADYKEACDRLQTANLIKDEQLAAARHHKYKRCLAMARWCRTSARCDEGLGAFKYRDWYWKWFKRWFAIAKQFKEAK